MADNKEDRLRHTEAALKEALDPNVTKFTPKNPVNAPIAVLIEEIRAQAKAVLGQTQTVLKMCDELDAAVASSEEDARKAADILITMASRIK